MLQKHSQTNGPRLKSSAFLFIALTACAQQQRPVVLAPVRMEPAGDTSTAGPRRVFDTQCDDPFATTNRIDWPGPNVYRSARGANEARYPGQSAYPGHLQNWRDAVTSGTQSPLMTAPDNIDPAALGAIGYRKPALVLLTLRNHVDGAESFDPAFREYIRSWAFKHPTPGDFFRSVENSTGEDLSWFWRSFFYTTDVLDIGIDSVSTRSAERTDVRNHSAAPIYIDSISGASTRCLCRWNDAGFLVSSEYLGPHQSR